MHGGNSGGGQPPETSHQVSSTGKQPSSSLESREERSDDLNQPLTSSNIPIDEDVIRAMRISMKNMELLIAIYDGKKEEEVKPMITEGVDVNYVDSDGNTALHYAVIKGNEEVVNCLLDNKADINIQNNNNKTVFDICKNKNIIRILGGKIIAIIEESKSENTLLNKEPNASSNTKVNELLDTEVRKTQNKINFLLKSIKALEEYDNDLPNYITNSDNKIYKQANAFILFLEIFAFHNVPKTEQTELIDKFLSKDISLYSQIVVIRKFILKNKRSFTHHIVAKIIELCYKGAAQETSKVDLFFENLKQYITCKTVSSDISDDIIKVSSFFKGNPNTREIKDIGRILKTDDAYIGLRDLVLKAYKEEKLYQSWFDFVVNIYPALDLEDKKDDEINHMEKQIRHIRNNLIHEFNRFGIQEFREAIINLRGKLFEYYYAKTIHSKLKSIKPGTNIEEIINKFNEDLEIIANDFKVSDECLSEKEAKNLFWYKFEKSIFPEQSAKIKESDLKELVVDYFKYIPFVENLNREEETDSESNKKLDDVARRKLLEMFIRLRRIKENCTKEVYEKEAQKKLIDITKYGVKEYQFKLVYKYDLKNELNDEVSEIIGKVVKFIKSIIQITESDSDYKKKGFLFLGELFLNKDILDKELVFNENCKLKLELEEKAKNNINITKVIDQVKSFGRVSMKIYGIIFKIDVRETVRNMLGTFYNAYNKYRIEFNIESIFSRENFLNELVWQDIRERTKARSSKGNAELQDYKTYGIINKLIVIKYMSPFIVKLIERGNASEIIDETNLETLIDNLLYKEEYVNYLEILLGLKVEKFKLYEKLYDKILKKKLDIKDIRSVFKEYKHLKGFADVLISKLSNNEQQKNIIELTKSFVKIINEEAADQLYYTSVLSHRQRCEKALEILGKGKKIQENFKVKEDMYLDFIDTDLLIVKIKNRHDYCPMNYQNNVETMKILKVVKDKLTSKIKSDASINYKPKLLLTLSDMVYTSRLSNYRINVNLNYNGLYSKIIKYLLDLEDIDDKFDAKTVKEKYNQVKNLCRYKNLLSSSELLHSEKYLDILKIAADSALQVIRSKDDTDRLTDYALTIYEDIYSCYKKDLGKYYRNAIQIFGYIADEYSRLGDICQKSHLYSKSLSYYLGALIRYNTVYDARKKMYGPDHGAVIKIGNKMNKTIMQYSRICNRIDQ